jgi:hypothetical protein
MLYCLSYKEDFIDWNLYFEDYFAYAKIPKDFKVLLVRDASNWWNDRVFQNAKR